MKTFELEYNDDYDQEFEDGEYSLCLSGLMEFFHIPENTRKIWVNVCNSYSPYAVRVEKTKELDHYGESNEVVLIDGKEVELEYNVFEFIKQYPRKVFYVSIDYDDTPPEPIGDITFRVCFNINSTVTVNGSNGEELSLKNFLNIFENLKVGIDSEIEVEVFDFPVENSVRVTQSYVDDLYYTDSVSSFNKVLLNKFGDGQSLYLRLKK